jgi:Na+-driven multidrug efflux pump
VITIIFMDAAIGVFGLSAEAHHLARTFLWVHCVMSPLAWPGSFVMPNALRAAGDARYVMLVASISMWTVRVSAAYLLCYTFGMGPLSVWLAMGADFLSRGGFYIARWKSGKWQSKRVI